MREYKSGTIWCVWRWTDVRSDYITRLHLVKTPWFAVCLHWIKKPDPEPYLHDHPVTFLSLILRGWYRERRGDWYTTKGHYWFNFIRTTTRHSICACNPNTLTLALMGPKTQEWGFYLPHGKVYWKTYYAGK